MKNAKVIHKLAVNGKKSGKIKFIHKDGKEHYFYSVINELTGNRMSSFDNCPPSVNDSLAWVKSVFNNIKKKTKVIENIGDF